MIHSLIQKDESFMKCSTNDHTLFNYLYKLEKIKYPEF